MLYTNMLQVYLIPLHVTTRKSILVTVTQRYAARSLLNDVYTKEKENRQVFEFTSKISSKIVLSLCVCI